MRPTATASPHEDGGGCVADGAVPSWECGDAGGDCPNLPCDISWVSKAGTLGLYPISFAHIFALDLPSSAGGVVVGVAVPCPSTCPCPLLPRAPSAAAVAGCCCCSAAVLLLPLWHFAGAVGPG